LEQGLARHNAEVLLARDPTYHTDDASSHSLRLDQHASAAPLCIAVAPPTTVRGTTVHNLQPVDESPPAHAPPPDTDWRQAMATSSRTLDNVWKSAARTEEMSFATGLVTPTSFGDDGGSVKERQEGCSADVGYLVPSSSSIQLTPVTVGHRRVPPSSDSPKVPSARAHHLGPDVLEQLEKRLVQHYDLSVDAHIPESVLTSHVVQQAEGPNMQPQSVQEAPVRRHVPRAKSDKPRALLGLELEATLSRTEQRLRKFARSQRP